LSILKGQWRDKREAGQKEQKRQWFWRVWNAIKKDLGSVDNGNKTAKKVGWELTLFAIGKSAFIL